MLYLIFYNALYCFLIGQHSHGHDLCHCLSFGKTEIINLFCNNQLKQFSFFQNIIFTPSNTETIKLSLKICISQPTHLFSTHIKHVLESSILTRFHLLAAVLQFAYILFKNILFTVNASHGQTTMPFFMLVTQDDIRSPA